MQKALIIQEKLGGNTDFKATSGWLTNFKIHHGIRQLIEGKCLSSDASTAESLKKNL